MTRQPVPVNLCVWLLRRYNERATVVAWTGGGGVACLLPVPHSILRKPMTKRSHAGGLIS